MKGLILISVCFILPLVILVKPVYQNIKHKKGLKEFLIENKYEIILVFLLMLGSFIRIFNIDKMPNALNTDEASSGYDAYTIMKYGTDRAGKTYPIILYAWGNGQSVLYS